jgi:hypothetical protein
VNRRLVGSIEMDRLVTIPALIKQSHAIGVEIPTSSTLLKPTSTHSLQELSPPVSREHLKMSYSAILLNGNTSGFRTFPPTAPKSVKRPLEDSDEEPYYFTRGSVNGYVRKTWELASPSSESCK